ncbi:phage tail tape measure protein [Brachybacterium sp. DNPG3]
MADRSIVVRLRAEISGFKKEMAEATRAVEATAKGTETAAKKADTALGQLVQSADSNREAWSTAGATLTGFGAATVGALALATKAAMDWESSWAGVTKTVDGTAEQMDALQAGLRDMALELPASHTEIAAVAEAAGQLGIATPNVLSFTRTMIDLGEATNLTSDQAATAIARFINITQTGQGEIGRLGAAIVGLGNNFATTESEILDMSMRLAGAGEQAGLTEGEILGMATAMSSVGIEAEAGGTAMSQTMKRIGKAVDEGGASLELFAAVSGMSAADFATAWEGDPASALTTFVAGLAETEQLGMSTNAVLTELGITGIREADALLRLSSATGVLSDAMATGNAEFEQGTALIEEASKRYETAESRIAMAQNALVDAGISIGSTVLPALADLADHVTTVVGAFSDLPDPVLSAITGIGGITGVAALAAGSFLLLFPRVMDSVSAFKQLRKDNPVVASGLRKVARAATVAGAAFTVLQIASSVADSFKEAAPAADQMAASLSNAQSTSEITAQGMDALVASSSNAGFSIQGVGDALDLVNGNKFLQGIEQATAGFAGFDTTAGLANERLGELDRTLTLLNDNGLDDAFHESFNAAVESAEAYGYSAEDLIERLPELQTSLTDVATSMGLEADATTLAKLATGELVPVVDDATGAAGAYADGMDDAAEATESAATAASEALTAFTDLANEFITSERAALDYADALADANTAIEENGQHWEDGTEAADENKRALLDLAEQALETAASLESKNESGTFLAQAREDLIEVATELTGSKELAEAYVDQLLGTPEEIQTIVDLDTLAAQEAWDALWAELGWSPPEVPVDADTEPARDKFEGLVSDVPPVEITADTGPAEQKFDGVLSTIDESDPEMVIDAWVDTTGAQGDVDAFLIQVDGQGGTVTINGETLTAEEALAHVITTIDESDGTVTINGQSYPADEALAAAILQVNLSEGTLTIDANPDPANAQTDGVLAHANSSTGTIDVDADTSSAESGIDHTARDRDSTITANAATSAAETALSWVARDRSSTVTQQVKQVFSDAGGALQGRATYKAHGGAVHGPGTATSDSISAWLSNGEHVITAAEVAAAGGHGAIYRLRASIRAGDLRLADGGGVERGRVVPAPTPVPMVIAGAGPDAAGAGAGPSLTFHNWNSDAVRSTREQVAQFGQAIDSMAVSF